jgi:hypothetical protein
MISNEVVKKILNFNGLLHNSLAEQLTSIQIQNYFELQNKWQWIGYIFVIVFMFIKTTLIATILYIGCFLLSRNEIKFNELWLIAINAEYVFLILLILKTIWFYLFQINYTLQDLQYFYPLSALNIVGYKGLEPWLIYPFQILNLFEVAYWLLLAYFIGKITETNMDRGLKIVASSYGSALLLWVVVIMFFTLNYS